jgi:hypothetical protein
MTFFFVQGADLGRDECWIVIFGDVRIDKVFDEMSAIVPSPNYCQSL